MRNKLKQWFSEVRNGFTPASATLLAISIVMWIITMPVILRQNRYLREEIQIFSEQNQRISEQNQLLWEAVQEMGDRNEYLLNLLSLLQTELQNPDVQG